MLPKDPFILLSLVNTKLRDGAPSLEALCRELGLERKDLEEKLASVGFAYDEEQKRFR